MVKQIKMKQNTSVLFLTKRYYPLIGGVEKHIELLSTELLKKGFSITILTEQTRKAFPLMEKKNGMTIVRIPVGKNERLNKFYVWMWFVKNPLFLFRFDILHIHDVFYYILPFRPFMFYKKVFITFHGYEGFPIKGRWKMLRKVAEYMTNGNICIGKFMKKWYSTTPTSVSYGAVRLDTKKYIQKINTAVFFGRLDEQTGILEYLKAYEKIRKKFPKFSLKIVGDGKFKKKIPPHVPLYKFTDRINPYIGESQFVFVSRYLSMLEALAMGKSVIATYDNAVKEDYLRMSPFSKYISIASSADEIANFVIENLHKKNDSNLVDGQRWARAQTWEKMATIYMKLWGFGKEA